MKKLGNIQKLAIASLAVLALAVPVAFAQSKAAEGQAKSASGEHRGGHHKGRGFGKRGGHRGGGMRGMMMKGINLSDEQKAQMKQIRQSFGERNKPLHQELSAKRQALRQANEGGTFNETLATQKLTEMAGLQAKLMGERFKLQQEMLAVLTPEQKTQLEQKRAEFKAKRAERGSRQSQSQGQ
jgi:protein CpxP